MVHTWPGCPIAIQAVEALDRTFHKNFIPVGLPNFMIEIDKVSKLMNMSGVYLRRKC